MDVLQQVADENEDDHQIRAARLEGLIFRQDERIEKLTDDVQGLQNQLEETQNDLDETQNQLTETRITTQNELTTTRGELVVIRNELTETRDELVITRNELRETRDKLVITRNELIEKLNVLTETRNDQKRTEYKLKELEITLQTGQIAFNFEKDLATYIYPHDKKFGCRKIFTNMKKWLEDKKGSMQGREANEKWTKLKEEFSWSDEHEKVFFKLLEYRRGCAHPAVDRDKVQSQIPDDFTDEDKAYTKVIIDMIERVNELMQ